MDSETPLGGPPQFVDGLSQLLARSGGRPTAEEAANIEVVRRIKSVPMAERKRLQTPDFVVHRHGIESLKTLAGLGVGPALTADSIRERHDRLIGICAKDDLVWAVWIVTGLHAGPILGVAATGRTVSLLEFGVWRMVDGKAAEAWFLADEVGLGLTLGLLSVASTNHMNSVENRQSNRLT